MARKKSSRRTRKQSDVLDQIANTIFRPEVAGIVLVLLSAFTLLSLVTGSRGQITDLWINWLDDLVGYGKWGLPLVTGIMGLWMVIRAIERMPDLPWQRPTGLSLIFVGALTAFSLAAELDPQTAGGWIGQQIAGLLASSLGLWGAWAVVTGAAIVGLVLLTDRWLLDASTDGWDSVRGAWSDMRDRRRQPSLQPALPMPTGRLPWWKRLRDRVASPPQSLPTPPNLVRPEPTRRDPNPSRTETQLVREPATGYAGPAKPAATPATETELLTPRIVGGAQEWRLPRLDDLLQSWDRQVDSDDLIRRQGRLIQETLALFGVPADFEGAYKGPSVTQYLIKPGYVERNIRGETQRVKVKVAKIASLSNDLALALAAPSVRIEAPIPGTSYVGVEVPNHESNTVGLKDLMESDAFTLVKEKGKLPIALGEDVKGQPIVADLSRMPHLLIAGATGSGKSVCINSIIACLLLTHTPDSLRLLMVDPKMVELSVYNGVPHLLSPVVTEVDRAAGVLFWAVKEMERRYQLFSKANARDLERYNRYLETRNERSIPYIVVVVDEMADLMMAAPEEVEKHICRLAQMARAVGIHLIIATQRPSVDVITGLIKANFPARIAFAVTSQVDSRVILDVPGAERLLGRGDMLFMAADATKLERLQGTYLSDDEISAVVRYWKGIRGVEGTGTRAGTPARPAGEEMAQATPDRNQIPTDSFPGDGTSDPMSQPELFEQIKELQTADSRDELYDDAVKVVREAGRGSVSLLQRKLRIGYNRASRLVDQLEEAGILGPDQGGNQGRPLLDSAAVGDTSAPSRPHIVGESGGEMREDDEPGTSASLPRVWM